MLVAGLMPVGLGYRFPLGAAQAMERAAMRLQPRLILAGLICGWTGCVWSGDDKGKADLGVEARPGALAESAVFRDTIGAATFYEGLAPLSVSGYGLVGGLGRNGSRDCPKDIYDGLVQELYKLQHRAARVVGVDRVTPEALINDLDTAVVVVRGAIPPAAVSRSTFDLAVAALPGTQTKSLEAGQLFVTELRVFRSTPSSGIVSGRTLARAAGPVFLNPFSGDDAATKADPLQGVVVGGGMTIGDRRVRLVLTRPSYSLAMRIQERINSHFGGLQRVADATTPSYVDIRVPREYHGDEAHFLGLVRALYVNSNPSNDAARARALGKELFGSAAAHDRITLCLEGLGRTALPVLNDLYTQSRDHVSFYSAATGLRLDDYVAGDAMALHARNPRSPYRFQAIRALGQARGMAGPAHTLRDLLHEEDPRVQIAAYEALIQRGDPTIRSVAVGRGSFVLDEIPVAQSNFVYAKRSGERRIAVFGKDLKCTPPIFYRPPNGSLTMTAQPDDGQLTVMRRVISTGTVSPPIPTSFDLPELIRLVGNEAGTDLDGRVVGLGLGYGEVIRMIHHLCEAGAVNAKFTLEQPNIAELFGPSPAPGRPESEL